MGPIQKILGFAKNDNINNAFKQIDLIITAVFKILASGHGYSGSDHCSGVLFGITGSRLVLDLGRNIASNNDFKFLYPKTKFDIMIEGKESSEVKTLYFPMKTTILQVKLILFEATKNRPNKIELFFGDQELSDDETLSYYNLPENAEL